MQPTFCSRFPAIRGRYMNLIENPDQARRLARAILSDVALYNKEKLEEGIKNDTLFDALKDELEEGRQHFVSRVASHLASSNIYDIAVVDVLVKRAGKIESAIW
jgi:spore germination protein GerM